MTEAELSEAFKNAVPRLDMFFQKKLKKAGIRYNREDLSKELLQTTLLKALEAIRRGQLTNGYQFDILVNINRRDIWADFLKERERPVKVITEDPETLDLIAVDEQIVYESNERIRQYIRRLKPLQEKMITYMSQGYNYGEIAALQFSTEEAVKQSFYRIRLLLNAMK